MHLVPALAAACLCAAGATAAGLQDPRIAGGAVTSLDGEWDVVSSDGHAVTGRVPGDIITDLQNAGLIDDPFYESNFLTQKALYADRTRVWTYKRSFSVDGAGVKRFTLVFDGVKRAAAVALNGKPVGRTIDQFLRYTFDVSGALRAGENTLEVTFDWGDTEGRFMACSGGWDWAPYTMSYANATDENSMSYGVWKSVYVVAEQAPFLVTHMVVHTFYEGAYAMAPLTDATFEGFRVEATLHLDAPAAVAAPTTFTLTSDWGAAAHAVAATIPAGASTHKLVLKAGPGDVKLWWPNGMGEQPLYNVTATVSGEGWPAVAVARRTGFRTLALVTGNETEPGFAEKYAGVDGTADVGMYLRINGAVMFSRGANMIPMEELDGRQTVEAYRHLVASVADANMNTLRIWGGGIFLPEVFYAACDELGIVLYHDVMYAQDHLPAATPTQEAELRYQVRRLSPHPSIAIWDGCNECKVVLNTSTAIYATFVLKVVTEEDASRVAWPSCPADGWDAGVHRLTGLPNHSPKGLVPTPDHRGIETHGPYQHTDPELFATINSGGFTNLTIPLPLEPTPTGVGAKSVFASEFGAVTLTSFESLSPNLDPAHWALHGGVPEGPCMDLMPYGTQHCACETTNAMQLRNYGCDSGILRYFGWAHTAGAALNTTGAVPFQKGLYLCMLQQAMDMKTNIELRRSQSQHGIVVWQLNEVWATGGWGSLEYGPAGQAGVVAGGRWKPLHHFFESFLYRDVIAGCGAGGVCFLKNDAPDFPGAAFTGKVCVSAVDVGTGARALVECTTALNVPAGGGSYYWTLPAAAFAGLDPARHILSVQPDGAAENLSYLSLPYQWRLAGNTTVTITVAAEPHADGSHDVTVTAGGPALYVVLTTLAAGRFSDNAFCMLSGGAKVVKFYPWGKGQAEALTASVRVEHLAQYIA